MLKRNMMRLLSLILAAILLVPTTYAAVYEGEEASLTIRFPYPGTSFELYPVADFDAGGNYVKTDAFRDCPVDIRSLPVGTVSTDTDVVVSYVQLWKMPAAAAGAIGADGTVTFSGMKPGLYLVLAHTVSVNGTSYTARPLLVCLPVMDPQSGARDYHVTISPKPGELDIPQEGTTISRKVLKIWEDENDTAQRPQAITVYLLRDGVVFDTVTLSAETNWRWRWDSLDANHVWTVAEEPVDGYFVSVEQAGITFVITNTRQADPEPDPGTEPSPDPSPSEDPEPSPTAEPGTPTLPQTGLLWWPVPVLAAVGMTLFILGWVRSRREDHES